MAHPVVRRILYGPITPSVAAPQITKPEVPLGIGLVYQVAEDKLAKQLAAIDQLDTKAGVLIGALGAAIGVFVSFGHFTHSEKVVLALALLVAVALATFAFLVRRYEDAPEPSRFSIYSGLAPDEIRTLTLQDLIDAKVRNDPKLFLKGRLINASIVIAGASTLYAFIVHVA
jgi:hypothetical protein